MFKQQALQYCNRIANNRTKRTGRYYTVIRSENDLYWIIADRYSK